MRARKRFGQHFLESPWVAKVLAAIAPRATDTFLEIGPGRGALTLPLAGLVRELVAVEVDRDLAAELRRIAPPNVRIVEGDFLELDASRELAAAHVRVAGNLPYYISSPILGRLFRLADDGVPITDATLMLQREVADRLVAAPGTGDYGPLSVGAQRRADVRRLLDLPPGAFRPPPKVRSALVRLDFQGEGRQLATPPFFDDLVRGIFTQRRKRLSNALRPFAEVRGVPAADALGAAGIDPARRPETLTLAELLQLASAFEGRGSG